MAAAQMLCVLTCQPVECSQREQDEEEEVEHGGGDQSADTELEDRRS